jgi:hypothetical protein
VSKQKKDTEKEKERERERERERRAMTRHVFVRSRPADLSTSRSLDLLIQTIVESIDRGRFKPTPGFRN